MIFRFKFFSITIICCFVLFFSSFANTATAVDLAAYQGVYTGTYEGVDKGIFGFYFYANGYIEGLKWSNIHGTFYLNSGYVNSNGIVNITWSNGDYFYLSIDKNSGKIQGQEGNTYSKAVYNNYSGEKTVSQEILEYIGAYNCTYSGDDQGSGRVMIDYQGLINGTWHSDKYGDMGIGLGVIDNDGKVLAITDAGSVLIAKIDNYRIKGEWDNPNSNLNGSFKAVMEGHENDGGGGGGGGCFIMTLY